MINNLIRIGSIFTFVAMVLIFAAGILWMLFGGALLMPGGKGTITLMEKIIHSTYDVDHLDGVAIVFKGIELVFIAPIVFLSFVSVCVFSKDRMRRIAIAVGEPTADSRESPADPLTTIVHDIKSLVAGLMVAVLLTHLVARVIEGSVFEPMSLTSHAMAVILCLLYYIALARKHP